MSTWLAGGDSHDCLCTTQGAHIIKDGRRLLVKKDGAVSQTLFSHQLEQLILCGNVQVTTQALRLLMHAGIDTVFLTRDGRYRGRLAQQEPKNVLLRQRQFELARDEVFCLRQARHMVTGKLRNMVTVLQRIRRRRGAKAVGQAAERLRRMLPAVETAAGLEVLRGLEGKASAGYFLVLHHGLEQDFGFRHRARSFRKVIRVFTSKAMLVSVGGSPQPLIYSLNRQRPEYVIYFVSLQTRNLVAEAIEPALELAPRERKLIVTPDGQNLLLSVDQLLKEVPEVLEQWQVSFEELRADYTGGTKTMSAAVVLALAGRGCRFSYVGGVARDKAGTGKVIDGQEKMLYLQSLMRGAGREHKS